MRGLRDRGLGLIYISHRFEEIFAIADRVTVLRDGRRVASAPAAGLDRKQLIRWMVGRDVSEEFPPRDVAPGRRRPGGRRICPRRRGFTTCRSPCAQGEIVGLAGLVGAGRTSAGLALAGALAGTAATSDCGGRPVRFQSPAEAIDRGVAYLTEDRKGRGILPLMAAEANLTLASLPAYRRAGCCRRRASAPPPRARRATSTCARPRLTQPAATLSGGNQQKLLLARYLLTRPSSSSSTSPRAAWTSARARTSIAS